LTQACGCYVDFAPSVPGSRKEAHEEDGDEHKARGQGGSDHSEESDDLGFVVLIVDGVSIGQHALMEDARNQNAAALLAVEHDVLAMLKAAQAGANVIAKSA